MTLALSSTNVKTLLVSLTDEELLVLDGRCRPETQVAVDAARKREVMRSAYSDLSPELAGFVADVVGEARANGQLVWSRMRIRGCALCGMWAGHHIFKSGRRRGRPDYDRPLTLDGVDLAYRFVRMSGTAVLGGCTTCITTVLPTLRDALRGVAASVPEGLRHPDEPVRVKWDNVTCRECGWSGHEGELGRLRTLIGDGTYPGICPGCSRHQTLGVTLFDRPGGFVVVASAKTVA